MNRNNENWYSLSDPAILNELGDFIQKIRIENNKTQQEIADAAGLNRSTLVQIEKGKGSTLLSFVQVLRALGQLDKLEGFEMQLKLSPLKLAALDQATRRRATKKPKTKSEKPLSDW